MQRKHGWDMRVSDALKRRRVLSSHGVLLRKCVTQLPSAFVCWVILTRTPRAMATDPRPMRDSPAVVDTAGLTQSELLSLSRSTRSSSDLRDVLIPEIDPSVFNESDATRRQTYSEFRPWKRRKRRQVESPAGEVGLESGGRELDDNHLIVRMLKDLIRSSPLHDPAEEERVRWDGDGMVERRVADFGGGGDGDGKRKRVRRDEVKVVDDEIVNRNGVVVDLVVLENAVDPYGEELRRRTAGLESEEECLGFLRGLDGKWASKRRKRRIVDACAFGDHLPVTWKLLLALRRKEGRIWVYCRSYISPNGQEFVSCKDVALYLQSVFGVMNDQLVNLNMENTQNHAGTLFKDDSLGNSIVPVVDSCTSSLYDEQRSEGAPHGTKNLVEVRVSSLFECLLCKFVVHEKKLYLQHVLSSHEKTTRRYRIGSQVRGGVILNEGQYECQFCYRIFQEKDSYVSHVGSHIIGNSNERLDRQCADTNVELSTLFNDGLQKTLSELGGASNKNLPNTVDTYTVQYGESGGSLTNTEPNVVASKDNSCYELVSSVPAAPEIKNSQSINEILKQALENQDTKKDLGNQLTFEGNNVLVSEIFSDTSRIANPLDNTVSHARDVKQLAAQHSKVPESKTQDLSGKDEMCSQEYISSTQVANSEHPTIDKKEIEEKGSNLHIRNSVETETNTDIEMKQNLERNVMTSGEIGSFGDFFKSEHVTEGENPSSLRHLESITEIEELKLDDIEPLKFSFPICDESSLMPVATMIVQNDADVYDFDTTRVGVGDIMCSMECRRRVTSVCVWCSSEFIHETLNSELQGDSVGYICTTCKAKISGQLNVSTMVYP
uniref:C2H2-type domain-containing protein n=1 Tax=Kalanchoe fedtschenkoi TaxID=63787 RepID=A0A7N0TW14_KALFE